MSDRPTMMQVSQPCARLVCAIALSAIAGCATRSEFQVLDKEPGKVVVFGTSAIEPGSAVTLVGTKFIPGQKLNILREGRLLSLPVFVDGEGKFKATIEVPNDAAIGLHNILISAEAPPSSLIVTLKISQKPILKQGDLNIVASKHIGPGLYQVAFSHKNNWLFVTSSSRDSETLNSSLFKLHPQSLEIIESVTPSINSLNNRVFGVYGISLDDTRGTVWVTNTMDDTVAVYRQTDLALLQQFKPGLVKHPRDVAIDEEQGKVFVSSFGAPFVAVFDAISLSFLENVYISSRDRNDGKAFSPMGMSLDLIRHELIVTSLRTDEVATINTKNLNVDDVRSFDGLRGAIAVSTISQSKTVVTIGQNSDSVIFANSDRESPVRSIRVDGSPVSVTVDQKLKKILIANRTGGTLTLLSEEGDVLSNVLMGSLPNHVVIGRSNTAYVVSKARDRDDDNGDIVTIIQYK